MCLSLFLASRSEIPLSESADLSIQETTDSERSVMRFFSLPHIRYVGAHTGCSCGFPHVSAEVPVEWYDGFFDDDDPSGRVKNVASTERLIAVVAEELRRSEAVEMYAVWNGEEDEPSKGSITLQLSQLVPERFFFNERFLYRLQR